MKIQFKINKPKLIVINGILSGYDHIDFSGLSRSQKTVFSLRLELRHFFIKKTIIATEKDMKIKLPYYLAVELLDVLTEYCIANDSSIINGIDKLKNELHQQLV